MTAPGGFLHFQETPLVRGVDLIRVPTPLKGPASVYLWAASGLGVACFQFSQDL